MFMEEAYRRMEGRGFRIGNVDVTLILQKPKVRFPESAFPFDQAFDVGRYCLCVVPLIKKYIL